MMLPPPCCDDDEDEQGEHMHAGGSARCGALWMNGNWKREKSKKEKSKYSNVQCETVFVMF